MKPIKAAMVSVETTSLSDREKYLLNQYNPLGVTLFKRNIQSPTQLKDLIKSIKECISREDVLIAVDQEGGRVQRLEAPHFRSYLPQASIGALELNEGKHASYLQAYLIADELKAMGFNLNYAPVVDVLSKKTGNVLRNRCFSSDEKKVTLLASQMLDAYEKMGIIPCLKHVPGHGHAFVDPHLELPVIDASVQELSKDFYPFKKLSKQVLMMMTAHIVLKNIDEKPVTQSKKVIDLIIRKEMMYDGFLLSDAIDMKALKGTLSEKMKNALNAGCDAVCYCMGQVDELETVLKEASILSDNSLKRFENIQHYLKKERVLEKITKKEIDQYSFYKNKAPLFPSDYDAVEILHKLKEK